MILCLQCKNEKEDENFPKASNGKRYSPCQKCRNISRQKWYQNNKEKMKLYNEKYRQEKIETIKEQQALYRAENREKRNKASREWSNRTKEQRQIVHKKYRENNVQKIKVMKQAYYLKNKEKIALSKKKWDATNRGIIRYHNSMRRKKIKQATPLWVNKNVVKLYYIIAQEIESQIGRKVHVDHYYPITSDKVCGLHCENNLRLMWAEDNLKKSNSFPENMLKTKGIRHGFN